MCALVTGVQTLALPIWEREMRSAWDEVEFSRCYMRLHRMQSEVTRTAIQKNIIESKGAEIGHQARCRIGKAYPAVKSGFQTPFDENGRASCREEVRQCG